MTYRLVTRKFRDLIALADVLFVVQQLTIKLTIVLLTTFSKYLPVVDLSIQLPLISFLFNVITKFTNNFSTTTTKLIVFHSKLTNIHFLLLLLSVFTTSVWQNWILERDLPVREYLEVEIQADPN